MTTPIKATETTAAELVGPMLESHPEVRPNAVMAENGKAPTAQPTIETTAQREARGKTEVIKDKSGEKFNPKKHYADKFGRPQYTESDYFRRIPLKKRLKRQAMEVLGRSESSETVSEKSEASETEFPKSENRSELASAVAPSAATPTGANSVAQSHIPGPSAPKASESAADENRAAAKALCATLFTLGVSIGGVQCKPLPQHVESMEGAWENYFRINGVKDVPPGLAVTLSTGGYLLFCYQSSHQIQEQSKGVKAWFVMKIGAWKTKRAAAKVAKQSPQKKAA